MDWAGVWFLVIAMCEMAARARRQQQVTVYGASCPWGGLRHFPAIWKPKTNDAAPKLGPSVNIFTYLTLANNEYLPIKLMLQTYVTMCCIFSHLQCP